jgi:hypothetical protein
MQNCIFFGNCQCSAIYKFLENFSNFKEFYNTSIYANWEMIKNNDSIPIQKLKEADLVIYQPLTDVNNCYSTNKNNPNSFFNVLKENCKLIAFPRIHNNALFPIFHKRDNTLGTNEFYGKVNNIVNNKTELLNLYENNEIDYNFPERMIVNYQKGNDKEDKCDIKIIDFIYNNIKKHKLFLTQDHPTSFIFNEVSRQICNILDIQYDYEKGKLVNENFANLPDSVYGRSSCQYPISRYSIHYFGFEYINEEDNDADEFYKNNTISYLKY